MAFRNNTLQAQPERDPREFQVELNKVGPAPLLAGNEALHLPNASTYVKYTCPVREMK